MSEPGIPDFERELYYLVTKFLENGPCSETAKVLKRQLTENKLLLPRKDWKGNEHERNFAEYDQLNSHIQPNHLLKLNSRLNVLVGNSFQTDIRSVRSLLPRGSLSLLRNEESLKIAPDNQSISRQVSSFHSAPLLFSSKLKFTSISSVIAGQSYNGVKCRANIVRSCNVYSKMSMHKRILGHLASVYCVLFDQTGSVIVTGADDKLLKLWSAKNGHLIATFRGHSGQITDIAINKENSFVASGSLDKTIRVWKLRNTYPVAVLQGHTGMVTSLKFCPYSHPKVRYLVSTGGDGNICFWPWYPESGEFSLTPIKFNEKTRPGAQMLCSSFSPGGSFLTTGNSDNYIRVYQLYPDEPEKIAELPNHADHVDSIVYSNFGARFLSGSRDGTAMIWSFKSGEWQAKCLDSSQPIQSDAKNEPLDAKNKLKVTMICWSANDKYVITAGTDFLLRVWDSYTTKLVDVLKGHTEDVYILETHPSEEHLLLSAGHDGKLILWDLNRFCQIKMFFNMLEGQGHGAIFDCKFSPTGLQFSATDSHGHLLIFGFGSDEPFRKVPYEQFFHSDYREIVRDSNNYVLDSQMQTAPHLMPPPYLVDIDGNPHLSQYQMLIPGRTQRNLPQLRVDEQPIQDLPPLLAQIAAAEAAERNAGLRSPGPSRRQSEAGESGLLSPGAGVGLRESGDIEGVRQENTLYVSGDITDVDAEEWRNRTIIPINNLYNQSESNHNRLQHGINEISNHVFEKRKLIRKNSENKGDGKNQRASRGRGRGRGGRTRQAKVKETVMYVRASALRQLDYLMPYNGNREVINVDQQSSESEAEDWQGESSDSSNDSDWVNETKSQKETTSRTQRRKKRREQSTGQSTADENEESDVDVVGNGEHNGNGDSSVASGSRSSSEDETKVSPKVSVNGGDQNGSPGSGDEKRGKRKRKLAKKAKQQNSPSPVRKKPVKKVKKEIKTKKPLPSVDNIEEYLAVYAPPEWLLNVESKKFPYFPQIGDEVYYLRQGHNLYVQEVIKQNEYDIVESRQAYRRYDLMPAELCKLVGISYDIGPPKMCSLKLEHIGKRKSTGGCRNITVRFHDMPNVVDFLVLKYIYDDSLQQSWKENDRFRCIIDDTWYFGTIVEVSPLNEEFKESSFLSLVVKWDSGDDDRVSPWDLEKIPDGTAEFEEAITEEDKKIYEYTPTEQDWPHEDLDDLRNRAVEGLEAFSALEIALPFAYPVDVNLYPTYWGTIAFPTDLETIRKRINNRFYRRVDSLLWEVRQLRSNAVKFNEVGSGIVSDATQIVKIICRFLKDPSQTDIISLYNEINAAEETKGNVYYNEASGEEDEEEEVEEIDDNEETENGGSSSAGAGGSSSQSSSSSQNWIIEAKSLLEFISGKNDAKPFLQSVEIEQFPDYGEIISEPIDISIIRHRLDNNQYDSAEAYIRDFQLMFRNSKSYNTDRRSPIYKMTLRLSALFEARCETVRKTYTLLCKNDTHMTRTRARNVKIEIPSNSLNDVPLDRPNSEQNGSDSTEHEKRSPRKPSNIVNKITLSDFVRKPNSRRSRQSSSEEASTSAPNEKNKRKKVSSNESSDQSDASEIEEEEEDNPNESSPEVAVKKPSPRKSLQRNTNRTSGRVSVKRVRYGFESEDEDEEEAVSKPPVKKKKIKQKLTLKHKSTTNSKKPIRNGSVQPRRPARSKTAVSYCEDDDYEAFEEEVEVKQEEENGKSSSSGSDSEEEVTASSSDEVDGEENTRAANGVSCRGRVRRAATRFLDYS